MAQKNINARFQNKHDVEANWLNVENFIPLQGEIIIYDIDENYNYERVKIGDGIQNVNDLPFSVNNHTHSASDISLGILPVERGGTGYSSITDEICTTARYRASSLHSSETDPTINGTICWTYE